MGPIMACICFASSAVIVMYCCFAGSTIIISLASLSTIIEPPREPNPSNLSLWPLVVWTNVSCAPAVRSLTHVIPPLKPVCAAAPAGCSAPATSRTATAFQDLCIVSFSSRYVASAAATQYPLPGSFTGIPTAVQRSDGRAHRSLLALVEAEARRAEWFPWRRPAWSPQGRLGGARAKGWRSRRRERRGLHALWAVAVLLPERVRA